MNENFNKKDLNSYEGNGWSKYQILVLQQLDDHNKVLQNLNKEIADLKQTVAVSDMELKMWKIQTMKSIEELDKEVHFILYDEHGHVVRLNDIERALDVEKKAQTKLKAVWALYAAIGMFLVNVALQIFEIITKN